MGIFSKIFNLNDEEEESFKALLDDKTKDEEDDDENDEEESRWESLEEKRTQETFRMEVLGGWLVLHIEPGNESESMVFVPDPEHKWSILNEK